MKKNDRHLNSLFHIIAPVIDFLHRPHQEEKICDALLSA